MLMETFVFLAQSSFLLQLDRSKTSKPEQSVASVASSGLSPAEI